MTSICYPPGADWSCAYSVEDLSEIHADPVTHALADRADALAWMTLQALSGYRLSICPQVLRPCIARCVEQTWDTAIVGSDGTYTPYISQGRWYNACGCKTNDCSCTSLCEVVLPAEVGSIESVMFDGAVLDPSAYRVDNGTHLVRTDGECWPYCQDMTLSADEPGSFVLTWWPGIAPNDLFRFAAGVLAVEYYAACQGKDCRLPSGVTSIARSGINLTIEGGSFPSGYTGIPEVDAVIRIYNPYTLKSPARVLSPDRPRGRVQTWGS